MKNLPPLSKPMFIVRELQMACIVLFLATSIFANAAASAGAKNEKNEIKEHKELRIGSTTTTQDSGLLEVLLPAFEKATGIKTRALVGGSGQVLKYGERGDVDVLLTHSPTDELRFIARGFGMDRREVMFNDFVIVGPKNDPLKLRGTTNAATAFKIIGITGLPSSFISRGDDSGTHKMEQQIWAQARIVASGKWYLSAGQGMAQTLMIANQQQAYTLTERGSFLALKKRLNMDVLVEPKPVLANIYAVIQLNAVKYPHINHEAAKQFANWLTSSAGQIAITTFQIDGKQVFFLPSNIKLKNNE